MKWPILTLAQARNRQGTCPASSEMSRGFTGLFSLALLVACFCQPAFGAQPVEFHPAAGHIEVLIGGRPFTIYYFESGTAKPYLHPLRSAQGTIVTRGFPMETNIPGEDHDEPHQRAMYFAHGDINGYDFWGEAEFPRWSRHSKATFGSTAFRKLDEVRGGPDSGVLRAEFDLMTGDGQVIATETQTYTFRGDDHSRIIDCEFNIRADHGPVKIGDTKEGTFAIRVVKALDSPPGRMVNSDGAVGEKAIWGKRADWVDYDGNVAGEDVGIAVFDHPQNLRHPTYWHARHYGLLAANPFGVREFTHDRHQDGSYTIPAGGSLPLRYRVFIHHGNFQEAGVADAYRRYAAGE
jgi:Methane oxygenase PmoA